MTEEELSGVSGNGGIDRNAKRPEAPLPWGRGENKVHCAHFNRAKGHLNRLNAGREVPATVHQASVQLVDRPYHDQCV
jgi:hypothetical protein